MTIYTVTDCKLLGDPDPKYGQTYWAEVEESNDPVKFNLMQRVDIMPGRKIFAEEKEDKTSKAGNDYTQLRKVKLSENGDNANDGAHAYNQTQLPTEDGSPTYEAGTNARWALKLSTDTYKAVLGRVPEDETDWNTIEDFAKWLLGSFHRLKSYEPGYEQAKATRAELDEEEVE